MTRLLTICLALGLLASIQSVQAQQLVPTSGLASNTVQTLDAAGDSLWTGPLLTLYLEPDDRHRPGDSLLTADVPVLTEQDNRAFSIAADNVSPARHVVWAGLAFETGETTAAGGFVISTDGGQTFSTKPPQLDEPGDTTISYGTSTLPAVPVTQGSGSAPQDFAFAPTADTVWVAGNRSGLRRTTDQGSSWKRIVLPPDTVRFIDPTDPNDFLVGPPQDDDRGWQNHTALTVLADETGTLWVGTPLGLNRSRPQDRRAGGDRAWRRFEAGPSPDRLTGNTVVTLTEQPRRGRRNPIWIASWAGPGPGGQRFGVSVTPDGGNTFRKALIGERVFDLAARETRIYAASQQGLFVSGNQGRTWRSVEEFRLADDAHVLSPDVTPQSVETTPSALWVGTTEGLLRLRRPQEARLLTDSPTASPPRWRLLRANVPVNPQPDQLSDEVPDVSTYAYPNPYVPGRDQLVRIVYELDEPQTVEVNIYDYGMNRVRTIQEQKSRGQQETAWNGTDDQGLRVPTGTYLYTVDLGDETVRGKIVLAN